MPRQNRSVENMLQGKIRKRGCSSSPSSTSTILREGYRFKRAILVGKKGGSTTPVPTWRLMGRSPSPASALRALDGHAQCSSPKYPPSHAGSKSVAAAPVSARKLAATLWEMNEIPSPGVAEEEIEDRRMTRTKMKKERAVKPPRSVHSGSLPPHLSDPSHSPVSERMDRPGTGIRQRRASSVSQKLRLGEPNVGAMDSISNASFMEIETRSRAETPRGSTVGAKTRLKDISNALTTSKELLKIINRMWGHEERPSSSMSLISALHAELERARLQVNQIIQEQRADQNEIGYLMKRFAEEKAAWKSKEQEVVEAAIESVAGELEVERKLRRRFESLNKKLGKELADTKSALLKAVKEIESEKRARTMIEKVCDELARDVNVDKAEVEELKRESAKVREEVEKEREMMQLADALREERVQMKLSEAKHQLEEKNAAVDKLRSQLQAFLGTKRSKDKTHALTQTQANDEDIAVYLNNARFVSHQKEDNDEDGEIEDGVEHEEDSGESDLRSIELNMDHSSKSYKWAYSNPGGVVHDMNKADLFEEEDNKPRKSTSSKALRRSVPLQRSISDGVDWVIQNEKLQKAAEGLDWGKFIDSQKQREGKCHRNETYMSKLNKGLRDHRLSGSKASSIIGYASPTRLNQELSNLIQEKPPVIPGTKSRLSESRGEGHGARKPRW